MLAKAWSPDSVKQWISSGEDDKVTGFHSRQHNGQYQKQTSDQMSCFFGLETNSELSWEDWDLGGEFTKTLVLKNIHKNLQKLQIRPPVSKFFSALIPEIVFISPGTSFSLSVTFSPLQRCEYEDSIEFQVKGGSFQVRLRGLVPCHMLESPDSVMLPLCAVKHSSQTKFLLKNISKLQMMFEWNYAAPFHLSPEQGFLKPGQDCHITVVFQPQEAHVYQQQAYCRFGDEREKTDNSCTVLLLGQAKYPYLQLRIPGSTEEENHPELHFGSVALGLSLCKKVDIFNPSPVNVTFLLSRLPGVESMFKSEFSCDVTSSELAPGESVQVSVTYSPAEVDTVSVEYLSLKYNGSLNEPQLKLTGKCLGPKVSLSSDVLDFGCIKESGSAMQTVKLVNLSSVRAVYQWHIDCGNSVFCILPASGTIPPHSHVKLKAVYKPTQPMAHYRRVACLILHRDPLLLDLIGTCHSELQQPEILKPEHLVLFKHHYYNRKNPPDALLQDHSPQPEQQGVLSSMDKTNQTPITSATPMEEFYQFSIGRIDLFSSNSSSSSLHVSVEPSELLFNHRTISSLSPLTAFSQSVSIKNHTKGKLRLVWTVAEDSPFTVSPSSCDLVTLKSTSFRVTYDPKQPNTLHGGQLECFAYFKDSSDVLRPPWCVTVRVTGHSFQPGNEHFTPSCSLKPSLVVFPALGVTSYRTVLLQNKGHTPLSFCLNHRSSYAESVYILPGCGLIQPGDHQIITIRATPAEDSPKQGFNVLLQLNAAQFTKELTIVSVVEKPSVSLESGSSLYFHPTAVGSKTWRTHHIRNLSRLPLQFQWHIPETDQKLISVKPDVGELHPNESSIQMWSFSPVAEKTYTLKPTLNYWPVMSDESSKLHLNLEVVGMGSRGSIEVKGGVLDVGDTLVGSCRLVEIPLMNNSSCPIFFRLSVQQRHIDVHPSYDSEHDQSALHLDCEMGSIASESTVLFHSTLRLCTQAQYLWDISYQILNANGTESSRPQKLCEVRAKGMFPTLQVVDACSGGSVSRLSKAYLWKLLSLDSLNENLLSAPSPSELKFKTPTKHSLLSCPSIFTKVMLDFIFSSAPLNSIPSEFMLMIHNPGFIPVDWALLFPEDQQIELEDWAVTGEFTSTELCQMKVQYNQLFCVSPRSGTLLPGQQRAVHFSYSHDFIGTHRLPVVFKVSYGREILLNLQGVTVERNKSYLHFAPSCHVFSSVAIGDSSPPQQMFELYNGGAVPVRYKVDGAVLSQLEVDSFNHPVICCLNPEGEVLPGKTAVLEWIFSPLEAKLYHMEVPIQIQENDAITVRFESFGVNTLTLEPSNSWTCSDNKTVECRVRREPFPGQVLFLSEDSVFLGDVPVCSQSSRIFFLTNVSHTDTVHYIWELPQQSYQKVVQIHPEQGRLCPGENTLCVLTFIPSDYPTVYQLELSCQVTLEAVVAQYREALKRWEDEEERQQNQFIITDKNVSENQRVLLDENPQAPPVRKGPPLRKYKTLPPISTSSSNEAVGSYYAKKTRAERRLLKETAKIWRRPQPPQPALLHLKVTAHSHRLRDYFANFPEQYYKYYRRKRNWPLRTYLVNYSNMKHVHGTAVGTQTEKSALPRFYNVRFTSHVWLSTSIQMLPKRTLQLTKTQQTVSTFSGLFTSTQGPERDIVTHILTFLLRDILDDSAFVQPLITSVSKPETYQPPNMPTTHCSSESSTCTPSCPLFPSFTSPLPHILLNGTIDRERTEDIQDTLSSEHVPADLCVAVLKNTLQNLMTEAVRGELDLTACPHTIILPPLSVRSRQTSKSMMEEKE